MFTCFSGIATAGWFGWFGHGAWMLLFWGALIGAAVWLARRTASERRTDPALETLKIRYVNSEIDREEYEERRSNLS